MSVCTRYLDTMANSGFELLSWASSPGNLAVLNAQTLKAFDIE